VHVALDAPRNDFLVAMVALGMGEQGGDQQG